MCVWAVDVAQSAASQPRTGWLGARAIRTAEHGGWLQHWQYSSIVCSSVRFYFKDHSFQIIQIQSVFAELGVDAYFYTEICMHSMTIYPILHKNAQFGYLFSKLSVDSLHWTACTSFLIGFSSPRHIILATPLTSTHQFVVVNISAISQLQ